MSMTIDQARALVHAMNKSPKISAHLECALGFGHIASAENFESTVPKIIDKCEEMVSYLEEAIGVLRASLEGRPRQRDMMEEAQKLPEKISVVPHDKSDETTSLTLRRDDKGNILASGVETDDEGEHEFDVTCAPSFALLRERLFSAGFHCVTDWLDPETGPTLLIVGVRHPKQKYVDHNLCEVPGGYALIPTDKPTCAAFAGISDLDLKMKIEGHGFEYKEFPRIDDILEDAESGREAS